MFWYSGDWGRSLQMVLTYTPQTHCGVYVESWIRLSTAVAAIRLGQSTEGMARCHKIRSSTF